MKISVAMATYNGGPWIQEQLQSIAEQALPPDELIICDDGSTDETEDIVNRFAQTAPFPVRLAINNQRLGPAQNFAQAISLCTGDLIALTDQDDRWCPEKIQRLHDKFVSDESIKLVFSDSCLMDESSNPAGGTQWNSLGFGESSKRKVKQGNAFDVLLPFNMVTGAGMAFRSSLLQWVLPIPEHWMHDEWIALIASAADGVAMIDDALQYYRIHPAQSVGPGVSGLSGQLAYARANMDLDYFIRAVKRSHAARDRLSHISQPNLRPDTLSLINERVLHDEARLKMRQSGAMRLPGVIKEFRCGRYRRFAYGWKSALQDLLLR
jgi:glycosyltransferase involved in cell wall biosynthesis